jgi:hypothetical protein
MLVIGWPANSPNLYTIKNVSRLLKGRNGRSLSPKNLRSIQGAQPRLHGLFVGGVLVFLLFKGKLIKHANHRMRQEAVHLGHYFSVS